MDPPGQCISLPEGSNITVMSDTVNSGGRCGELVNWNRCETTQAGTYDDQQTQTLAALWDLDHRDQSCLHNVDGGDTIAYNTGSPSFLTSSTKVDSTGGPH